MSDITKRNIAVVGCGIAGMSAAILLRESGHDVRIFEKFDRPKPLGAGLLLQPTGLAVLEEMGLAEEAIAQGRQINRLDGWDSDGSHVLDIDYRDLHPGLFGVGIHRATLFDLLYDRVKALKIPIEAATEILETQADVGGDVSLNSSDGKSFGPFNIVVAADGANSALRSLHGDLKHDRPCAYGAIWGVVDALGFDDDCLVQRYAGPRKMMGVLPLGKGSKARGKGKAAVFWSVKTTHMDGLREAGLDKWREEALRLWPETAPLLEQFKSLDELFDAKYSDTMLHEPVAGRIVFLGDSAHVTSPQLGQGANMALLDASALNLGLRLTGSLIQAFQHLFEQRRHQTKYYCWASRRLTPFFQSNSAFHGKLRNWSFPHLNRIKFTRMEMLRTLSGVKTSPFRHMAPEYFVPGKKPKS